MIHQKSHHPQLYYGTGSIYVNVDRTHQSLTQFQPVPGHQE